MYRFTLLLALFLVSLNYNAKAQNLAVSTTPVGLLVGMMNAEVDYKLHGPVTVGGTIMSWTDSYDDGDDQVGFSVSSLGVRSNYYFGGDAYKQGWYGGLGVESISIKVDREIDDVDYTGSAKSTTLTGHGGYHWQWTNFFQQFGLVLSSGKIGKVTVENEDGDEEDVDGGTYSGTGLEYRLGWVF